MSDAPTPVDGSDEKSGLTSRLSRLSRRALPEAVGTTLVPPSQPPARSFRPSGAGERVVAPEAPSAEIQAPGSFSPRLVRQAIDPNQPASWKVWGLPDFDDPAVLENQARPLPGAANNGAGWNYSDCPRCSRAGKPSPSLLIHNEGRFLCMSCGWQGDARVLPSRHLGTWVEAVSRYLVDVSHLPEQAAQSYPGSLPKLEWGSLRFAPAWDRLNSKWVEGWWLSSLDSSGQFQAAWQGLASPSGLVWSRPSPMPCVPLGTSWAFRPVDDDQPAVSRVGGVSGGRMIVLATRVEDFLALNEAGLDRVTCLPPELDPALPGAPAWQFAELWDAQKKLLDSDELVLALPSSQRTLEEELGRRLSRDRCFRVRYALPEEVPLGDASELDELPDVVPDAAAAAQLLGLDALVDMVSRANPFPVKGIHELDDMDDAFEDLYRTGLRPGHSTGFPSLDEFYTVEPGQWTLITGIPGHGKSALLDGIILNLARRDGWRFGLFSPENQPPERHFAGLMEKLLDKPFSEGYATRISIPEKNAAKRWLNDRFKVILPDENEGEWTLDAILALAKILVRRYGIQGLVIDPWNEIDHSSAGDKEVSYLSQALTKIRRFARLHGVHVWIVAHPTKLQKSPDGLYPVPTPYDVAGGAHWRNKADNALCAYRFVGMADQVVVDVHIQKIRLKEIGRVGLAHLRTNPQTGAWIDDIDYDRRAHNLEKSIREDYRNQILPSPRLASQYTASPDFASADLL